MHPSSEAEVNELNAFLQADLGAAGDADALDRGELVAAHELVSGRRAVGEISTLFGNVAAQTRGPRERCPRRQQ